MRNPTLLVMIAAACGSPPVGSLDGEPGQAPSGNEGDEGAGAGAAEGEGEGEGEASAPCQPLEEGCDGVDNDCDGEIDEGIEGLGAVCARGLGGCRREGVRVCTTDGAGTYCGAEPGFPEVEDCDAVDDDCDGATDEAFGDLGAVCTRGVGGCAVQGVRVCAADGSTTACDATESLPAPESCDGVDNDCDGVVDNAPSGLAPECDAEAVGACAFGAEVCLEGRAVCVPAEPRAEICDGVDDDCDGSIDEAVEGLEAACDTGALGECSSGAQACAQGEVVCLAFHDPVEEVCDGVDNDCDGTTDNDPRIGTPCDTGGIGACGAGTFQCVDQALGCVQAADAVDVELCDGRDDDCDGATDEAWPELGDDCSDGKGECRRVGVLGCAADGQTLECDAVAGDPGVEQCNGLDDNCDGSADEPWPELGEPCATGVGACATPGIQACDADGVALYCAAEPRVPGLEMCDDVDNDCDGSVDEAVEARRPQLNCRPFEACQAGACVELCSPDDREPDDRPAAGLPLELGVSDTLNFCDDTIDWVVFSAVEGRLYDVVTASIGQHASPVLDIFDEAVVQVGFGGNELLGFRAPSTGPLWVRLQNLGEVEGPGTEYSVMVRAACQEDAWEDDDGADRRAVYHLPEGPQRRTLCTDDDWTSLYVRPDRLYTVRTHDLAGGADTFLELTHVGGAPFLADDDGGEEPFASTVRFIAEEAGQYLIRVGSFGGRYGGDRAYTLTITEDECGEGLACQNDGEAVNAACVDGRCTSDCSADSFEDDDQMDVARLVVLGQPACGNFCDDRQDWRRVRLIAGRSYDLQTYRVAEGLDLQLTVDANFGLINPIDGGAQEPREDLISAFEASETGDHLIVIDTKDRLAGPDRDYCFLVREACDDDAHEPDDQPSAARHVIPGDDLTEHTMCDEDWTVFFGEQGQWYRIETLNLVGGADTVVEVYSDYGATFLDSADEGSPSPRATRLHFQAPSTGDFHVLVRDVNDAWGGDYGYSLLIRSILAPCDNAGNGPGCGANAFCFDGECKLD